MIQSVAAPPFGKVRCVKCRKWIHYRSVTCKYCGSVNPWHSVVF